MSVDEPTACPTRWLPPARRSSTVRCGRKSLAEFVGQTQLKEQLSIFLDAAKGRGEPCEHVLLAGPPGLGKTSLAGIIAVEMNSTLRIASGPAIDRKADMAAILTALDSHDVLFIDEIHRLNRSIEELLYPAMEDGCIDLVIGQGPGAQIDPARPQAVHAGWGDHPHRASDHAAARPVRHHPPARLLRPGRHPDDRRAVGRSPWGRASTRTAPARSPGGARGTPRVANRHPASASATSPRCAHQGAITHQIAVDALELFEVDSAGLERIDRAILSAIAERFSGGPVGLSTLAVAIGEEPDTLEDVYEPFLLQLGMIQRTPRGRIVTPAGYAHLGLPPPARDPGLF